MGSADHHLDAVLYALGPRGKFAILQIATCCLGLFPGFLQLMGNLFIGLQVSHRCAHPQNESSILSNFPDLEIVNITYDECQILVTTHNNVTKTTGCLYGMEYTKPVDYSFISTFDLVCDYAYLARFSQTLVIAGQGLGAITSTFISDRLGRKPVIVASNCFLMVTGLVAAYAPSYPVFAVFKFFIGVFQQSVFASFVTIILEILVTKHRWLCPVICGFMLPLCYISLDGIAVIMKGTSWRTLGLVLSLPSLIALFQWWYLAESPRWLAANGKSKSLTNYLNRAAKCNGKSFTKIRETVKLGASISIINQGDTTEKNESANDDDVVISQATKKLSILDVFRVKRLAITTLLIWLAWLTAALSYFTIYMKSTELSGDPYLNFFLISLMEPPSTVFFYYSYNRIGRRWSLIACYVTVSFGFIASGIFESMEQTNVTNGLAIASSCIGMVGSSGAFMAVFSYTPELYPTNVRNQALGICSLVARAGGMIGPFMGVLGEEAKWFPGLLVGGIALIVAFLLPLLPETNGMELPQTLEDLRLWFKDVKWFSISFRSEKRSTSEKEATL